MRSLGGTRAEWRARGVQHGYGHYRAVEPGLLANLAHRHGGDGHQGAVGARIGPPWVTREDSTGTSQERAGIGVALASAAGRPPPAVRLTGGHDRAIVAASDRPLAK